MKKWYKNWCLVFYTLLFLLTISVSEKNDTDIEENLSEEFLEIDEIIPVDSFEIIEEVVTIRPIKKIKKKNKIFKKPHIIEPDAEMLPIHYKRIQPPGVDHMEMIFAHPNKFGSQIYVKSIVPDTKSDEDLYKSSKFINEKYIHST
ncbi:uncharacterized protein LOC127286616 [Leptopilina boulardi]|uniref:uncharacterized protein LOC127286616 n=1 Tax=Leptopilina boulardi TaxID=63433 RepID=UPI0021F62F3A|nr:uncharacterized protein LOC127286616 [Leptopilina boulardi]